MRILRIGCDRRCRRLDILAHHPFSAKSANATLEFQSRGGHRFCSESTAGARGEGGGGAKRGNSTGAKGKGGGGGCSFRKRRDVRQRRMPRRCWTALRGGIDSVHLTSHGSRLEAGERERKSIHPQPLQGSLVKRRRKHSKVSNSRVLRLGQALRAPWPQPLGSSPCQTCRRRALSYNVGLSNVPQSDFVFGWAWRRGRRAPISKSIEGGCLRERRVPSPGTPRLAAT